MLWQKTDPVQAVDALLVKTASPEDVITSIRERSKHFDEMKMAVGDKWVALFSEGSEQAVLPRIEGAIPLYEYDNNIWLSVGWLAGVPAHVEPVLMKNLRVEHNLAGPTIIIPHSEMDGDTTQLADIYLASHRAWLDEHVVSA